MIKIIDNDLYVGTYYLSELFNTDHRSIKQTIKNNLNDILEFNENDDMKGSSLNISNVESKSGKKRKIGRPTIEYLLNEQQATFVILLLRGHYNSNKTSLITKFKKHVTNEFFKQRKLLNKIISQKQNTEWLEKREAGKVERRLETDAIRDFIDYAIAQGSKNAHKYYMIISKMENKTLFHLDLLEQKFPNVRDIVEGYQLVTLQNADRIVARALKEGMEKEMYYKDIYIMAKDRIERFVELIGKSPIQVALMRTNILT